jgi:hypothetical protein
MFKENPIKLAPLPVPTGAPSGLPIQLCIKANDVYIDLATKQSEMDIPSFEAYLQIVFTLSNTLSLLFFIVIFKERLGYNQTLSEHLLITVQNPWLWLSTIPGALCLLLITLNAARRYFRHPPIRFNRQRREVVYVPERGSPPVYIPWEQISAGIYPTHSFFLSNNLRTLKFGFHDRNATSGMWHSIKMESCSSAESCWESIRCYMERECEQFPIPDPMGILDRKKISAHPDFDWMDYTVQILFPNLMSGWTLPVYLSRWAERCSYMSFPASVRKWSAPLPADQWQRPSMRLQEASRVALAKREAADRLAQ